MTDPTYTAVALLADRSGSMAPLRQTAEDSIAEFIASQAARADQRVTVRLDEFDGDPTGMNTREGDVPAYHNVFGSTPAADCPRYRLNPRGMTALYDAMARSMTEFGAELAALPEPERPATVVWAVMTDGQENASMEHTAETVAPMIKDQRETYGWKIVFLGADEAAVTEAIKMGVDKGSAMVYAASNVGTRSTVDSLDSYVVASAAGPASFTAADRKAARRKDHK
jgi:hypothetical protein